MAARQGALSVWALKVQVVSDAYDQGVASFHLQKLIPDLHFNDSTLVVNPCNSPEQVPITFGVQLRCI